MLRLTLIAMLLRPHAARAQTAFERDGALVLDGGDVQHAAAAQAAGCADGDDRASRVRYFRGTRDIVAAADPALIRRACALEDAIGCIFLGNAATAGLDPISPDGARSLISACEDRDPYTCEQHARNLPRLSLRWPAAACAQGEVVVCTQGLGKLAETGRPQPLHWRFLNTVVC